MKLDCGLRPTGNNTWRVTCSIKCENFYLENGFIKCKLAEQRFAYKTHCQHKEECLCAICKRVCGNGCDWCYDYLYDNPEENLTDIRPIKQCNNYRE